MVALCLLSLLYSCLPPDDRLEHIDEAVGSLEQESGIEGIQDVMSPARHSGNGGTGTDTYLQLQDFYLLCMSNLLQEMMNKWTSQHHLQVWGREKIRSRMKCLPVCLVVLSEDELLANKTMIVT